MAINSIAGPRLVCDAPKYDFGEVIGQEEIVHEFLLENRGDEPAIISNIKNCCGVTSSIEPMTILPGSNAVCRSVFNTKNRYGPQDKQILIASNDRKNPYFDLRMTGNLLKAIEVSPWYLRLGDLLPDSEIEQIITATNLLDKAVVLESVHSTVPGIVAKVVEGNAEGISALRRSWEVSLHATDSLSEGKLNGQIKLTFSTGTVSIPVLGTVEPLIRAVPDQILLSSPSGKTVERLVMLRSGDGSVFEVVSAELVDANGSVAAEKVAEGKWRLKVSIDSASVENRSHLRIATSNDFQPVVAVPLRLQNRE